MGPSAYRLSNRGFRPVHPRSDLLLELHSFACVLHADSDGRWLCVRHVLTSGSVPR